MESISSSSSNFVAVAVVLASVFALVHSMTLRSDTEALQALRRSIDPNMIPPSSYISSWDFSVDPCDSTGAKFLGILCSNPGDNLTNRIVSIELDSAGYDGFLTHNIGNLAELTLLDLSRNQFRGPLPDSLKNLKKLTMLSLSGNFFTGGIGGWINGLKNIESIDLSENLLSGPIPTRTSELRRLTRMSLANNEFSGRIPDINGLWKLDTLDLGSNMFVGSLPKLPTKLRSLILSHNQLAGHITELGSLKELRHIDLSDNKFTGSISRSILSLPSLNKLNISFNQLTSIEVNTHLGSSSPLQVLNAQRNRLQGHLPVGLVNFENLQVINLGYNGLTGRIPLAYGQRLGRPWRSLFLDDNFLSGRIPRQFNSSGNRISGNLANNCLSCPSTIPICGGGQRPASACIGEIGNQ
ncbi:LRR receptor-like serine/threonine-protein kinase FLS2-like [Hibiscus syriacus]|uniref:LRR receptor-like serine/threonine-protein kinase FLS2-like n=1 Tax=Hibiscus syriacus TaxID=106335 RepID=A0A6A3C183_HIBSY|nr:receptor-like protein kinase [Hibiscus syriacus]KAE8722584.1 LRR receptor-like serine/threonine-protein kinase FLS2-like [Hibiscus syriacus]